MEKLSMLQPNVSQEANQQAEAIYQLMQEAAMSSKSYVIFETEPFRKLHPLVYHTLASKGFIVEEIAANLGAPCSNRTKYSIYT